MSANMEQIITNIRKATKGLGTDEKLLIDTVLALTPEESAMLDQHYKANYGKSVLDVIESETSGQFGKLLAKLCVPEPYIAARSLHKAMAGAGTDEQLLRETLVGRSNAEINAIKQFYQQQYGKSLEDAIRSEVGGDEKKFYTVMMQAMRDEKGQNSNVQGDVELFYKAGEGKIGTDEAEFIRLLCNRQEAHLARVFDAYAQKHGRTIDNVIKKEFGGRMETTLREVAKCISNKPEYFADLLESSMAGVGTNENKLQNTILRLRGTPLMQAVNEVYLKKYGKTLAKRIQSETSGDHEKLLVALVNQNPKARMWYFA